MLCCPALPLLYYVGALPVLETDRLQEGLQGEELESSPCTPAAPATPAWLSLGSPDQSLLSRHQVHSASMDLLLGRCVWVLTKISLSPGNITAASGHGAVFRGLCSMLLLCNAVSLATFCISFPSRVTHLFSFGYSKYTI